MQCGGAALYTPQGKKEVTDNIAYYRKNAEMLLSGLRETGLKVYGGTNSPYIWVKTPDGMSSWEFFDRLLDSCHIVGTPGCGFGPSGEGYLRLTAFNTHENTIEAVARIRSLIKL